MSRFTVIVIILVAFLAAVIFVYRDFAHSNAVPVPGADTTPALWFGRDIVSAPRGAQGDLIRYGYELIAHTAKYIGPAGSVAHLTNGMNCQNCHLDAGSRPWGNNYGAVAATYPKFRDRSGSIESIIKRVDDCCIRSLNGTPPDSNSREMQAMVAYIKWLGAPVAKGQKPYGSGIRDIPVLSRAADPGKGKIVFQSQCVACHGDDGQGMKDGDDIAYQYPPLWGPHSYNSGAGLFRLSRFAGYVKYNMPYRNNYDGAAQLTDEEAWDVAAFVNSQPRPVADISLDWPDISKKPFDHPFGPYADGFSEQQHKYGPFGPVKAKKR